MLKSVQVQFATLFCCLLLFNPSFSQTLGCPEIDKVTMAKALGVPDLIGKLSVETATCDGLLLQDSVGFRLTENSLPVYGGIRSEVALDFPYIEGESLRYAWEMKFPVEFMADYPLNRWWLVAQWHDQPDRRIGETWDSFPPRSPSVALYIEVREGVPGLGVIINGRDKRSWTALPLGEWLQVSMAGRWSSLEDGDIAFDIGGHPQFFVRIFGSNMRNHFQHYLKFGQYRHPKIKSRATVFFRKLMITKM